MVRKWLLKSSLRLYPPNRQECCACPAAEDCGGHCSYVILILHFLSSLCVLFYPTIFQQSQFQCHHIPVICTAGFSWPCTELVLNASQWSKTMRVLLKSTFSLSVPPPVASAYDGGLCLHHILQKEKWPQLLFVPSRTCLLTPCCVCSIHPAVTRVRSIILFATQVGCHSNQLTRSPSHGVGEVLSPP